MGFITMKNHHLRGICLKQIQPPNKQIQVKCCSSYFFHACLEWGGALQNGIWSLRFKKSFFNSDWLLRCSVQFRLVYITHEKPPSSMAIVFPRHTGTNLSGLLKKLIAISCFMSLVGTEPVLSDKLESKPWDLPHKPLFLWWSRWVKPAFFDILCDVFCTGTFFFYTKKHRNINKYPKITRKTNFLLVFSFFGIPPLAPNRQKSHSDWNGFRWGGQVSLAGAEKTGGVCWNIILDNL